MFPHRSISSVGISQGPSVPEPSGANCAPQDDSEWYVVEVPVWRGLLVWSVLLGGINLFQQTRHGAIDFAVGHQRAFNHGPIRIIRLQLGSCNLGNFVFVRAHYISETVAACL